MLSECVLIIARAEHSGDGSAIQRRRSHKRNTSSCILVALVGVIRVLVAPFSSEFIKRNNQCVVMFVLVLPNALFAVL